MEDSRKAFFGDENELPDDIDCLFHLLQRVEPPQAVIQRILAQAQVPYGYGSIPVSPRPQAPVAKGLLKHLAMMQVDELDVVRPGRNLC
jgi:hypothetical protein